MSRGDFHFQKGEYESPGNGSERRRSFRKERGFGLVYRIYAFFRTFLALSFIVGIVGLILVALLNHFTGDALSGGTGREENE